MKGFPRNISLLAGGSITALFAATAGVAHFWTPFNPRVLSIVEKLQPPNRTTGLGPISWAAMFCP